MPAIDHTTFFEDPQDGKLIPLTQGYFAMVDKEDYERTSRSKWRLYQPYSGMLYAIRTNRDNKTEGMHHFVFRKPASEVMVRHINKNGLDNRKRNLRSRKKYESKQERQRQNTLWKKYKITCEDYNGMYDLQNGLCLICGEPGYRIEGIRSKGLTGCLVIDHDRDLGPDDPKYVRGLLHNECNMAIGLLKHNKENCLRAAAYLESTQPDKE